jgi:mutator protein MutT
MIKKMKQAVIGIVSRVNDKQKREYLFIKPNSDNDNYTDKYYPPGGGVNEGETEQEAIKREFLEELNLQVVPVKLIVKLPADIPNVMLSFWQCEILEEKIKINKDEIKDAKWFSVEQIASMPLYSATKKLFQEYLQEKL